MQRFFFSLLTLSLSFLFPTIAKAADSAPPPAPSLQTLQQEQLKRAEVRLRELQDARAKLNAQFFEIRNEIRDQTGLVEVTPESIRQVIGKLQEQREQLELDGAGAAGRRKGIDEAVAALSAKLKDRAASDPVADELAKVVEVRETQLTRMQELHKQAVVSQESIEGAQAALATARAELAAARRKVINTTTTDVLDAWNRQRLELTIGEQERQARLEYISKRLGAFSKALGSLDQLEELRSRVEQAEHAAIKAQDELDLTRRRIEMGAIYEGMEGKAKESPKKP
jgi:predicted  nucleic acid-binding Zn-ribbon protein